MLYIHRAVTILVIYALFFYVFFFFHFIEILLHDGLRKKCIYCIHHTMNRVVSK